MDIRNYIFGKRKGKKAHEIEKQAMTDEFLNDALDGYQIIPQANDDAIKRLSNKVTHSKKSNNKPFYYLAASIILVLGLLYIYPDTKKPEIAVNVPEVKPSNKLNVKKQDTSSYLREEIEFSEKKSKYSVNESSVNINKDTNKTVVAEEDIIELVSPNKVSKLDAQSSIAQVEKELNTQAVIDRDVDSKKIEVKGQIVDVNGELVPYATISQKNAASKSLSDIDGYFDIKTEPGSQFEINSVGYEPSTLKAENDTNMLIALHENKASLDELVVIGYGSTKRKDASRIKQSNAKIEIKEYKKYLEENVQLPANKNCRGKVVLQFKADGNGNPNDIEIKQSLCPEADNEAIRLIKNGPRWRDNKDKITITVYFKDK